MSTPDRYVLLVQDHTLLIPLDYDFGYDTHVLYNNNNTFLLNQFPTGWEHYDHYSLQELERGPWMSDSTTISLGSSTSLPNSLTPSSILLSTTSVISTASFPPPRNFTAPFPSPPARTTTVTTNILTTTAYTSTLQTTNTNYVSTSTATQPAALATEATSLLDATSSLTHTNFILVIVFGALTILLLVLIIILFCLYTRRKRRRRGGGSDRGGGNDSEDGDGNARRMSVAAPGAIFISQEPTSPTNRRHHRGRDSLPRVSQAPLSMNMALSSNPYGEGPAPRIDPALFPGGEGGGRTIPLAMANPTRFSRSASNPESALWMPRPEPQPTVGNVSRGRVATPIPFPRLNVGNVSRSGTVVRSAGSGSPVSSLTPTATPREPGSGMILGGGGILGEGRGTGAGLSRQPSLPLYHRALQEQASHQRERAGAEEAGRLGIPVITGFLGAGARGSTQSGESEFYSGEGHGHGYGHEERHTDGREGGEHEREVIDGHTESDGEDEGEKEMEIYDAGIEGSGDYGLRTELESRAESHARLGNPRRGEVRSSTRASSGIFPE